MRSERALRTTALVALLVLPLWLISTVPVEVPALVVEAPAPEAAESPATSEVVAPAPTPEKKAAPAMPARSTARVSAAAAPTAAPAVAPARGAPLLLGADAAGIADARAAGWTPDIAQIWVGRWVRDDGWGHVESRLRQVRDAGVTPQVQWYYWGADISPDAVRNGANGKSVEEWNRLAGELAGVVQRTMGSKTTYVVLETEFNKNGVESWGEFNGHLHKQIGILRSGAPSAKLVLGFGSWKSDQYGVFSSAAGACDLVGFQMMRAATRDDVSELRDVPSEIREHVGALKRFGKPVLLTDLALGTHSGWEGEQETVIRAIAAAAPSLRDAGLVGIVLRSVRDDPQAPLWEYFGAAERTFGLRWSGGSAKPAWDDWIELTRSM